MSRSEWGAHDIKYELEGLEETDRGALFDSGGDRCVGDIVDLVVRGSVFRGGLS